MLQCLQRNEAVADDGDNLPFFGGPGTPLTSTAPSRKGTELHKVDVVTSVAPDGTPDTRAGNHDFITFPRGMQCATCKQVVRIWCNTYLVCHACFSAGPHPCTEVVVNVLDDVCEDGENNNVDELETPRKPDKRRGVAKMQAKLVMAAHNGKRRNWTRAALSNCLGVRGVKAASGSNRQRTRDLAMQHVLPLLAQWDAFVPDTDRVTRFAAPPSSSQPCCSQLADDMDKLIDEQNDGAQMYACACLLFVCNCTFFFGALFSKALPMISSGYSTFPFFLLPHFPHFPLLVFNVANVFFFGFCNFYVCGFSRWFPNDQWFFNCVKASRFPLRFCFFNRGGGHISRFRRSFSQPPPLPKNPRTSSKHRTQTHVQKA